MSTLQVPPSSSKPQTTRTLTPQQQQQRKKLLTKSNTLRNILSLKALMDKRKQQRSLAIYYLINQKYQSALIVGRQLMFSSLKIWKQFSDQFKTQFQQQFFFRTTKCKQHVEYLLDTVILCRIFIAGKKREDTVDILDKLEMPDAPIAILNPKTDLERLEYNEAYQIYSKTCGVILNLIEISKNQKLLEYTDRLYMKYLKFIKKYYSEIQYASALYKHASYLYQSQIYDEAADQYQKCIEIRKKNVYNGGLIDALVNSSICLKQLCHYELAITRLKSAIQINKDIFDQSEDLDNYYLLLAKMYFQMGDFRNCYKNFLYTFKLRENLDKGHPKKIETELNFIFFYKTLMQIKKNPAQHLNLTQKKDIQQKRTQAQQTIKIIQDSLMQRQDFAKYKQFKTSKMAHLNLVIPHQFFQLLTSSQINQLNILLERLTGMTFMRGVNQLYKSSFYYEKKTKDILLEHNPHAKNVRFKISEKEKDKQQEKEE